MTERSRGSATLQDEEGISTTEYLILMVLVVIAGFGVWAAFGDALKEKVEPTRHVPTTVVVDTAIV